MSHPSEAVPSPVGEFQTHFGGPPGSADAAAECKKWEALCGELLVERQKLREELANVQRQRDQYLKTVYYYIRKEAPPPTFTREEVFAHLDDKPTLEELIAELEREYAPEK